MQDDMIRELRQSLQERGSAVLTDSAGRVVALVNAGLLGIKGRGRLMVAYEGKGCFFFDGDRPLNQFRLVSAGFGTDVAGFTANLINAVVFSGNAEGNQAKAIAKEGDGDADHIERE